MDGFRVYSLSVVLHTVCGLIFHKKTIFPKNDMPVTPTNQQLFPHKRWLVCRPEDYDVRYQINPWMDLSKVPEKALASTQWTNLHHHLIRLGAWLEYVEHAPGVPDMVFTANAGLVRGRDVVLSRFRFKERQGEEAHFRAWFEGNGFRVLEVKSGSFEGEGDALFNGDRLFCGYGFRSDLKAHEEAAQSLGVQDLITVELKDPRFYHLDTCFCPLTPTLGMFNPGAFSADGIKALERCMELIRVPEHDAARFVCNAVVLGTDIVLPAGCPDTYRALGARGFTAHPVELSEFIKAGGAAKCLSLKLTQ
jgi:N-dimethylarginine dimethylaminohydrolase